MTSVHSGKVSALSTADTATLPAQAKLTVSGIDVHVTRKPVKNLHFSVYPPDGYVRMSVPESTTDDNIRLAVITKLSWIKAQQKEFAEQERQSARQYVSGECHYSWGKMYRLEVVEHTGKNTVKADRSGKLKLFVKENTTTEQKEKLLNSWYREQIKASIPELLDKWQPKIGKYAQDWSVKKMKTKWGSCNIEQRRIWLNLELAKKPPECLEYILVHELVHLHERDHNARFKALLEKYLPNWQSRKKLLNSSPLAHEDWQY